MSYEEDAGFSRVTYNTDERGAFVEPVDPEQLKEWIDKYESDNEVTNEMKTDWKNELATTLDELGYKKIPMPTQTLMLTMFRAKFQLLCYMKRLKYSMERPQKEGRAYQMRCSLREVRLPELRRKRFLFKSEYPDSEEKERLMKRFDTMIEKYESFSAPKRRRDQNERTKQQGPSELQQRPHTDSGMHRSQPGASSSSMVRPSKDKSHMSVPRTGNREFIERERAVDLLSPYYGRDWLEQLFDRLSDQRTSQDRTTPTATPSKHEGHHSTNERKEDKNTQLEPGELQSKDNGKRRSPLKISPAVHPSKRRDHSGRSTPDVGKNSQAQRSEPRDNTRGSTSSASPIAHRRKRRVQSGRSTTEASKDSGKSRTPSSTTMGPMASPTMRTTPPIRSTHEPSVTKHLYSGPDSDHKTTTDREFSKLVTQVVNEHHPDIDDDDWVGQALKELEEKK